MSKKVGKYISIKDEAFATIKSYSIMFGIPLTKLVDQLCISFLEDKDKQVLDHRNMKF